MSYSSRRMKRISPLLQTLLIQQASKVLLCLDEFRYVEAWACFENFLCICPPDVRNHKNGTDKKAPYYNEPSPQEETDEVKTTLNRICGRQNINVVLARVRQSEEGLRLLRARLRPLLQKVVDLLYDKGYLEAGGLAPKYPTDERLGMPK